MSLFSSWFITSSIRHPERMVWSHSQHAWKNTESGEQLSQSHPVSRLDQLPLGHRTAFLCPSQCLASPRGGTGVHSPVHPQAQLLSVLDFA